MRLAFLVLIVAILQLNSSMKFKRLKKKFYFIDL